MQGILPRQQVCDHGYSILPDRMCGWSEAGFTWPDWMEKRWYWGKVVCSSNLYDCKVGTGMCYLSFTLLPPNTEPNLWPSVRCHSHDYEMCYDCSKKSNYWYRFSC